MSERVLPIIVIYKNPSDYPGKFIVRRQWACRGGGVEVEAEPLSPPLNSVYEAREYVPPECDARIDPDSDDDPAIFEVWL